MGENWETISNGTTASSVPLSSSSQSIFLRATANVAPSGPYTATFAYSADGGTTFLPLGPPLALNTTWNFFMGYRFAIFNYATVQLGGEVNVPFFQLDEGEGGAVPANSTAGSSGSCGSSGTTGGAGEYEQCGGLGWTGPPVCEPPNMCTCA